MGFEPTAKENAGEAERKGNPIASRNCCRRCGKQDIF